MSRSNVPFALAVAFGLVLFIFALALTMALAQSSEEGVIPYATSK